MISRIGRYCSQSEVDEIISEYESKLRRAYDIIESLTFEMRKKNKEIQKLEFYVEVLAKGLNVTGDVMREMRNWAKNG